MYSERMREDDEKEYDDALKMLDIAYKKLIDSLGISDENAYRIVKCILHAYEDDVKEAVDLLSNFSDVDMDILSGDLHAVHHFDSM